MNVLYIFLVRRGEEVKLDFLYVAPCSLIYMSDVLEELTTSITITTILMLEAVSSSETLVNGY
jgi:hypothetical protein